MSAKDTYLQQIRLLSVLDLEELAGAIASVVATRTGAKGVGIIIYDNDMDALSDRYWFGDYKRELASIGDRFCADFERKISSSHVLNSDDLGVKMPERVLPIICHQIDRDEKLCACLLLASPAYNAEEMSDLLADLPLGLALTNAWEHSELNRENDRLRSSYEEIEEKTGMLEEQTMKLIHDVTVRDSIRTKHVERERLVYWISNFVRSSFDIQKVLDTTVEKIGTTFTVSRCMVLRYVDAVDQMDVFEFHQDGVVSAKELFFSEDGFQFTSQALNKMAPQDIGDPDSDTRLTYDRHFLKRLGIRSGLIVPLIMRERVLGVLFLQDCAEPRDWSIDDISLIGSLADNLSVAIENAELHQELARQAVTDGLTGVANRRSFNDSFTKEFERAKRYNEPLSLVMIDLDFLKKINDTYGHKAGDDAIASIGKLLKASSRVSDVAARYGGEEFCLLLPNTGVEMAEQLAERVRRKIAEVYVEGPGTISASIGVSSYPAHAADPDELFHKADSALYVAKANGRNQVRVAAEDDGTHVAQFADDKIIPGLDAESTAEVKAIEAIEAPIIAPKNKTVKQPNKPQRNGHKDGDSDPKIGATPKVAPKN